MSDGKRTERQPLVVVDAGVLAGYPDLIGGGDRKPRHPTMELENAHIVITLDTIRELAARPRDDAEVLSRLRWLIEQKNVTLGQDNGPLSFVVGEQRISLLPSMTEDREALLKFLKDSGELRSNVTVLTNNPARALEARVMGLKSSEYHYELPAPYTGRRDLVVPYDLFDQFWNEHRVSAREFLQAMPEQWELHPNEFVVMKPDSLDGCRFANEVYDDRFFRNVARYDASRDALVELKHVRSFPTSITNAGQAMYAEALASQHIVAVICTGPAGSGKTYMASNYGVEACREHWYDRMIVVPCELRSDLGALPGGVEEKMEPLVQPIKDAMRNRIRETHYEPDELTEEQVCRRGKKSSRREGG